MKQGRLTYNVLRIAHTFLQASSTCVFTGYRLSKTMDLDPTTTWTILGQLEERGWLTSEFENGGTPGRPARRLYSMTEAGREAAMQHLAALQIMTPQTRSA